MRFLLALAFVLALASRTSAQMTPLWKLGCTQSTYPLCNASGHEFNVPSATCTNSHCKLGVYWTAVYMPGSGPNGEDVVRITIIGVSNVDEFYTGWKKSIAGLLAPQQGDSRFFRYLIRIVPTVRWHGPGGGRVGTKFIMGGSVGSHDDNRLIDNMRSATEGDVLQAMFRTERNISAGRLDIQPLPVNVWLPVQLEVRFSTTASAMNAGLKKWLNAGNYGSPTGQTGCTSPGVPAGCTAYNWSVGGWSGSAAEVALVGYWQTAGVGSNVVFDLVVSGPGAFEYDDQWDPNWHLLDTPVATRSPTGALPGQPTGVRLP